jgi:putative spermidine/putrescine transport system permease protein
MGADLLRNRHVLGWLQAAPLTLVLLGFLMAPIVMIVIVSFWGATEFSIYPAFLWDNTNVAPLSFKRLRVSVGTL